LDIFKVDNYWHEHSDLKSVVYLMVFSG